MSRLTDFARGAGRDDRGRTIAEVWAFADDDLEAVHDFIQWLFPLRERSGFNPAAPTLTVADVAEFRSDPTLQESLRRSLDVFLGFVGLVRDGGRVVPATDFERKARVWRSPDHNWLRVTRVLASTRTLGLEAESLAFFEALKGLRDGGGTGIRGESFGYWERAATDPLG